jgi:hypothetical protein
MIDIKAFNPRQLELKCQRTTMAIIHCGFVPHQNNSINQRLVSKRNNPADVSTTKS